MEHYLIGALIGALVVIVVRGLAAAVRGVASHERDLAVRVHQAGLRPTSTLDFTRAAARGELELLTELDWSFPVCGTPRRELATPRSLQV